MFDVNFFGMVRVLRRAFPEMLKKGYGRILNVSSEVALKPSPGCIHYSAAKTAVLGLSRGLAEATRGTEVTVNSLIYGPCWTEGEERSIRAAAADTGESVEAFLSHFFRENEPTSIAGRYLTPEELADTALYYCSPLSRAVNGASVRIDGGIVRHI